MNVLFLDMDSFGKCYLTKVWFHQDSKLNSFHYNCKQNLKNTCNSLKLVYLPSEECPAVAKKLDEPTKAKSLVCLLWHLRVWKWNRRTRNYWQQQVKIIRTYLQAILHIGLKYGTIHSYNTELALKNGHIC